MKLRRKILLTFLFSALAALLTSAILINYLLSQDSYSRDTLNMRMANFGFNHPIPSDKQWYIPEHEEASYPQTIIGYEPRIFMRSRKLGGYDIFFYANPEKAGIYYDINVREINSKQAVEFSPEGAAIGQRPLSTNTAHWEPESSLLPLQDALPIIQLRGNNEAPYVIEVIITERGSSDAVATAEYLVIGNRHQ